MAAPAPRRAKPYEKSALPHDLISSENVVPITWETWEGVRHRHAGAKDPRIRLCEPNLPDVTGAKYLVVGGGGPPTGVQPLLNAVERMIDRADHSDRVVAFGSQRPIAAWKRVAEGRTAIRVDHVGASVVETKAIVESGSLDERGTDHALLRVRMRRRTLERIREVSEIVRRRYDDPEGREGKYMSTWVLGLILDAMDRVEAEVRAAEAAGFSGSVGEEP